MATAPCSGGASRAALWAAARAAAGVAPDGLRARRLPVHRGARAPDVRVLLVGDALPCQSDDRRGHLLRGALRRLAGAAAVSGARRVRPTGCRCGVAGPAPGHSWPPPCCAAGRGCGRRLAGGGRHPDVFDDVVHLGAGRRPAFRLPTLTAALPPPLTDFLYRKSQGIQGLWVQKVPGGDRSPSLLRQAPGPPSSPGPSRGEAPTWSWPPRSTRLLSLAGVGAGATADGLLLPVEHAAGSACRLAPQPGC